MEASRLPEFRSRLQHERGSIERHLADYGATVGRNGAAPDLEGFADSAHTTAERSEVLAMIDELESSLKAVDSALTRIDAGTYGRCERCDEQIPVERLEAIPTASLCVSCKQRRS